MYIKKKKKKKIKKKKKRKIRRRIASLDILICVISFVTYYVILNLHAFYFVIAF